MFKKVGMYICIIVCLVGFTGCGSNTKRADELAELGKERFIAEDCDKYIKFLKDKSGLSDLKISTDLVYDAKENYYEDSDKLYLTCYIEMTSDEISDGDNSLGYTSLKNLRGNIYQEYEYKLEDGGTVEVITREPTSSDYIITTSAGKVYELYCISEAEHYSVDGNTVSFEGTIVSAQEGVEVTDNEELVTCWGLAKKAVESKLKSPSSAKFPFAYNSEGVSITKSGDTYTVSAWVEAQNSYGATIQEDFIVKLQKSGSEYTVESCDIQE